MGVKYKEFSQLNLPSIEKEILEQWKAEQAFEKSVDLREGATPFVFYEGPPSANGMPGIHHVIARALKDLVCRYKTMKGFQVKRKGGWDTHGLPVELEVEKELGITKEDIGKKISVEEYNQKCREAVLRYKDKWDELTVKMGYWVDLNDAYITFDNKYIETLWWLLKQLYERELLYESVSIQPYSPAAGTGLSSHELNQPGCYKDVKDMSCVAMFKALKNEKSKFLFDVAGDHEVFFLAWTTTPWTLPSNLGLAVGTNIDYVLVKTFNSYTHTPINVILAKALMNRYFEGVDALIGNGSSFFYTDSKTKQRSMQWEVIGEFKGKNLEGISYEQLLPFEANKTDNLNAFKILTDEGLNFVTTEDGTGIVHTAPAFGADDFRVGKKYNIGILIMVDKQGRFLEGISDGIFLYREKHEDRYVGEYVKEDYLNEDEKEFEFQKQKEILSANGKIKDLKKYLSVDDRIVLKLQEENRLFKKEKYEHSYPHCWRTDKPVLYYPLDSWFIKTTARKDRMIELNKTINWKPKSTGDGRFGNWLENMVDWNLSRSRFWGTPLPVWKTYEGEPMNKVDLVESQTEKCVGSKKDLFDAYIFEKKNNFLNDLQDLNSGLRQKINDYNNSIEEGFKDFWQIPVDKLLKNIQGKEFYAIDLARARFRYNPELLIPYSTKIGKDNIDEIDLHKPIVDNIFFIESIKRNKMLCRVADLIDVWFDSGAMPYAQWGLDYKKMKEGDSFPFGEGWDGAFPADFIAEGVDQTRGWFYTLHAIAALVFDSVAYKTCVSNGLVLDRNGNKMSKRVGNVVDPFDTIEKFGADATRWYLITNASPWDNLKFDSGGIKEVQRKFFGTLYNTYQFFVLYANVDGFAFKEQYVPLEQRPEIDKWIISSLNTLVKKVNEAMDEYEPTMAGRLIEEFVDEHLSNWYVRLCRRRFWKGEYSPDKICAYQTLYECLETVVKLMAPISPFFSDAVFQNLNSVTNRFHAASVHHSDFPIANEEMIDRALEERMQLAQDASSLILSLRKKVNIKVRQPLQKVLIPVLNLKMEKQLRKVEDLIKAEVNVKEVEYLTDTEGFIKKKIKPNFVALGKKLGPKMKAVSSTLAAFRQEDILRIEKEGQYNLSIDGEDVMLQLSEVEITSEDIPGWTVANKGTLTVALDVTITPELEREGNAREFVNRIQKIRKESGFELTDRIEVKVAATNGLKSSLAQFNDYICAEILADKLELVPEIEDGTEIEINDISLKVIVSKKG
jgi:isoleucyl-tRNA synthetase